MRWQGGSIIKELTDQRIPFKFFRVTVFVEFTILNP